MSGWTAHVAGEKKPIAMTGAAVKAKHWPTITSDATPSATPMQRE